MASHKTTSRHKNEPKSQDPMLREFLIDELRDIYWAEKALLKALPQMAKAASTEALQDALLAHREETQGQVERLEQVFNILCETARGKKCEAMAGLTEEAKQVMKDTEDGTATRDVAIIVSAQKAEHYEIAAYGSLIQIARALGEDEVAGILEETLKEEKAADEKLTQIAESEVNYEAADESAAA